MDDHRRSAPDLEEQFRHAVLNLPVDVHTSSCTAELHANYLQNPVAYLRELKRLQELMLNIEFDLLDHGQEPEKVRQDFRAIKKNVRELLFSPAALVRLCALLSFVP